MGCGCQKGQWKPPTAAEVAAQDKATAAAVSTLRGRMHPDYYWNGPKPATAES